jgi:heavy metal sensor kinase
MRLTLRLRLTLWYTVIVAFTITVFAGVAFVTVSTELSENLDASLARVGTSLQAVIRKQQLAGQPQLQRPRRPGRRDAEVDAFDFLRRNSLRDHVGPLPLVDVAIAPDPVWGAVYEHILFSSATYRIQVSDETGAIVWRSDNLGIDSLPTLQSFVAKGASVHDDRYFSNYTFAGMRYRLVLIGGNTASVSVAYPVDEIDATLRQLFALLLWSMPVALFVSICAGWFLARHSLRPIDEITRTARRITAQNLQQRLPVPPTNDEVARLTATLNEMIARLETSFDRVRQFTADASHELKTPLAILLGEIELALRKELPPEQYRDTLMSCLEEVERLTKVVQGLLDLSRADSGQMYMLHEPLDVSSLLRSVIAGVNVLADAKRVILMPSIATDVIINGDEVRLHQAFLNIIENAVKYTASGGRVEIALTTSPADAVITVVDSGAGIPTDSLPHIFDRFYRVDQARSQEISGTGLGLSITRWIVDAHHGSIAVTSEIGKGTTFTITLPLYHVDTTA